MAEPDPGVIALADPIACVRREIALRRAVYPRWVEIGRITQAKAAHEVACMEAVLEQLIADSNR